MAPAADSSLSPYISNPTNVDLTRADPRDIICYLSASGNDYNGKLGARISALFVILILSTSLTLFPVMAKRVRWMKIPLHVYLFARFFGAGVIVATAFIHLLDPAYQEIGPASCVGMTGHWADFSWVPAIVLTSVMAIFLLDFGAERYVEMKYGVHNQEDVQMIVTNSVYKHDTASIAPAGAVSDARPGKDSLAEPPEKGGSPGLGEGTSTVEYRSYRQQIAAFLILELGVIFHSVIIGLNLGVVGKGFGTLYAVIVFHQSFEGLGLGARMSTIPFPQGSWLPWMLCALYGLTTPVAIAIGLGIRNTYSSGSFTAQVVSGLLNSMSAGILIYTGLVELLARDFLFNPHRTQDNKRLSFMIGCVLLGAGLMALLGKWA